MTWNPNCTVTVDSVDFTSQTLDGVSITYGRQSVWEQPRAGFATIRILNTAGTALGFEIRDSVTVTIDNSSGVAQTIFTGKIAAIENVIQASGNASKTFITQISAVSVLSDMNRILIGGSSYPKEYDDDRLDRILTEAGVPIDVVDTPGVYEFTARSGQLTDAYSLASKYATMAFGYIYETPSGEIGYANESRRTLDAAASGYLDIPDKAILSASVQSERTINNLLNDLTLVYKNSQEVTASNATSITNFGLASLRIDTELEQTVEAQVQADRYITLRANAHTNIRAISVYLNSIYLSNAERNSLIDVYVGLPVELLSLPGAIYNGSYLAFVEGWTFNITEQVVILSLTTTDNSLSITPTRWQDVNVTLQWEDVDPAIQWFAYE
jgi:hypothetical protein